jgi:hypothetical protein
VLRGLSEFDILKLLGQLQEQVPGPIPTANSGPPEDGGCGPSLQTSSFTDLGNNYLSGYNTTSWFPTWFYTRRPFPVFLLREIPEMMPLPVYLPLAVLGGHFRSFLHSSLRVRKPENTPRHARFHFRFIDLIPEMEPLRGSRNQPSVFQNDAEGSDGTGKQEILLP